MRILRAVVLLVVTAAALTAPRSASAAAPPTILTAGINAADALYATWSLGAGTKFVQVEFATDPAPDPLLPEFFANGNFAAFDCSGEGCGGTPTSTSYTVGYPIVRDRRYFVRVTAEADGDFLPSAVWVIDETKPLIPGDAPTGTGTGNSPATGRPLAGPAAAPPAVTPTGRMTVPVVPRRIGTLLVAGVRVRVTCSVACDAKAGMTLNGRSLASRSTRYASGGTRTLVLRPAGSGRARLRGRPRARLRLSGSVTPLGGAPVSFARSFIVRR